MPVTVSRPLAASSAPLAALARVTASVWLDCRFDLPIASIKQDDALFDGTMSEGGAKHYFLALALLRLPGAVDRYPFRISHLKINHASLLFLLSEPCVEYQFMRRRATAGPIAVAAYGDSFLDHVATSEAFDRGGYEVMPLWTEVDRRAERMIKSWIAEVLRSPDERRVGPTSDE